MNFKKHTKSSNLNIYLNGAAQLGYGIEVLEDSVGLAKITANNKTIEFYKNIPDIESVVPVKVSGSKYVSNKILQKEFPGVFPDTTKFDITTEENISKIVALAEEKNFQVVIKPNDLSSGKGVTVLPKTTEEVVAAVQHIKTLGKKIALIQDFLPGEREYRIVLFDNKIFEILERKSAFVTGNGIDSIAKLIQQKNTKRQEFDFPQIKQDQSVEQKILEAGHTVNDVLTEGDYLKLVSACNFGQGGEVKRINLAEVNPKVIALTEEIAKFSRLRMIGLDYIGTEITSKADNLQFGFNEINAHPMQDIHFFADIQEGKPLDSIKKLLQKIFA